MVLSVKQCFWKHFYYRYFAKMDAINEESVVTQFQNRDKLLDEIKSQNINLSKNPNLTPDFWKA